jgi:AcrR family transcriptional regulator
LSRVPKKPKNVSTEMESPRTSRLSREERRLQLLQVAMQIFSQKGFRGTTTKEIAQAAGVNEALVFNHFANKDELYAAILESNASEIEVGNFLTELRRYAERRDDKALFRALAAKTLEYYRENTDFLRLMLYSALEDHELAQAFRAKRTQPVAQFLCDYISQRQHEGVFRSRNPKAAVHAFLSMLNYHALLTVLFGTTAVPISDQQAVEHFAGLFLDGMYNGAAVQPQFTQKATTKKQR